MMNNNSTSQPTKHPLLILCILFLIFVIPIVLAWYFYEKGETAGEGTTNYGQLIQPPKNFALLSLQTAAGKSVDAQQFKGKWLLLLVIPHACNKSCEKMLYNMGQIRLATGKNLERIQRLVLTFSPLDSKSLQRLAANYSGTIFLVAKRQQFASVMSQLSSTKLALNQGYLYLVDPLGNIMMSYPLDANPSGIFKDLQRLLRVSQIG